MALPKRSTPPTPTESSHQLKHRVNLSLTKLSDRDTHAIAAADLDSLARSLSQDSLSPFLSCILHTDPSDSAPVRKHAIRLLAVLAETHGDSLSPFLPKMLASVLRRLRDSDTGVRSACVESVASMASRIKKPSFLAFLKPLMDALLREQDQSAQIGAALCLASAIEACPDPGSVQLRRVLPKLVKLLRNDVFKAKPALMGVIGSVLSVGGVSGVGVLGNLVDCLVEFLGSEDWATRKAAAEALLKVGVAERDLLVEFKASCLVAFEARRFDKVKVVREVMNQMIEVWKDVPDVLDEVSTPLQSTKSSCREDNSDTCFPLDSATAGNVAYETPQNRKIAIPTSRRSTPSDNSIATTAKKGSPFKSKNRKSSSCRISKLDHKKQTDWKIEIAVPNGPSSDGRDQELEENESFKYQIPQPRRIFFNESNSNINKFGGMRASSQVVPFHEESLECTADASNGVDEFCDNYKDNEDLSLIRKQLVQIENQQSSLFDLLQRFIGSSQNGIRSLETRVHGLELALDEISYDFSMSTGRMPNSDYGNTCCKLPGTEFLSSKFRRKTEVTWYSTLRLPSTMDTSSNAPTYDTTDRDESEDVFMLEKLRFSQKNEGAGLVINNPLAEIYSESSFSPNICSNKMLGNIIPNEKREQACNGNALDMASHAAGISITS